MKLSAILALALTLLTLCLSCGTKGVERLSTARSASSSTCTTIQRGVLTSGVSDALINPTVPGKNYGSSGSLSVGQAVGGTPRESLIRFDLSTLPANISITSAIATLTTIVTFDAQAPTRVHRVTAPWTESAVTWSSFAGAFSPTVEASFPVGSIGAGTTADLTALAQGWYAGTIPNHGVLLERDYTGGTTFASSEASAAQRPALQVCYTAGPSCTDATQNGNETDVDCGGGTCPTCANTKHCTANTDCTSALCYAGTCYAQGVAGTVVTSCSLPTVGGYTETIPVYDSGKPATGWGVFTIPPTGTPILGAALLVHGGRWEEGATGVGAGGSPWPYDDVDTARKLAKLGYVVYAPACRSATTSVHPAQASDVLCAARFLRDTMGSSYPSVPAAMFVLGASAGAHLSALVAYAPSVAIDDGTCPRSGAVSWRGVIGWSGIYDLRETLTKASSAAAVAQLLGYDPAANPAGALAASPWQHVNPLGPSVLLAHGDADATLPASGTDAFHAHALAMGISSTNVPITGSFGIIHAGPLFDSLRPAQGCSALQFLSTH